MVTTQIQPFSAGIVKILLLGAAGSGKSSIVQKYFSNQFQHEYFQTFGSEMYEKSATDPKKWSMQIWSVGGHERYRTILSQFYNEVRVVLLCFDVMSISSFQELVFWYNEVKRNCPDASCVIVGTKADEPDSAVVKPQDIIKVSKDWGIDYKITSAKMGTNIEELFEYVSSLLK